MIRIKALVNFGKNSLANRDFVIFRQTITDEELRERIFKLT